MSNTETKYYDHSTTDRCISDVKVPNSTIATDGTFGILQ